MREKCGISKTDIEWVSFEMIFKPHLDYYLSSGENRIDEEPRGFVYYLCIVVDLPIKRRKLLYQAKITA